MAFLMERFDIVKQYADKTGLYVYHDTVGSKTDPTSKVQGDLIAAIKTNNFFNPVADILQVPGALIMVTATDGAALFKVTQVYDSSSGAAAVQIAEAKLAG